MILLQCLGRQYICMTFFFLIINQEAAQALISAQQSGSQIPNIMDKASEYISRSEILKHSGSGSLTAIYSSTYFI